MTELSKQNWIIRMCNIFNNLNLNILYSAPSIRKFLRESFYDSISVPTTEDLLKSIITAQENGLIFKINEKSRKLILRETSNSDKLYELKEFVE